MKSKLILILALLLGTLACGVSTPTPAPSNDAAQEDPTATFTPEPAKINAAPEVKDEKPASTATFTPEHPDCVELLTPLDKVELPAEGKVTFTWTALDEAELYILNFIFPDGLALEFETAETSKNRYMEAFSMHPAYNQGGEHQWNVTTLNADGEEICNSDFFTFTKPTNAPQDGSDGDSGDGSCTGFGCNTGGTD
ncbi:MAG: hypothetical protein ISR59_10075 [Anaerolineales bacterium]|uniref:Uncharacterized protein n=1 Tax=Candidatus Desulfolinea nitratireducens TaxID=2841698 RepID=A0A8J6NP09_9CHLR|nr:hypothetical protein [Candidatus Desulfolinea nitratireducens]MBL6961448.1 hypothetical protein [Anaerolineales bacterium]